MKNNFSTNFFLWLSISLVYVLIGYYTNTYIITDIVYYNSFAEQLSFDRIEKLLSIQKENRWLGYVLLPVFIFIKVLLISGCIYTVLFLFDVKLSFRKILQVVYIAEFVFLVAGILRIVLLDFFYTPETLKQLQQFAPLSVYGLFNPSSIPLWFGYPLQLLNLFELVYIITLSYLLSKEIQSTFRKSLLYVLGGYGAGLALWCVIVIFIQLQYS